MALVEVDNISFGYGEKDIFSDLRFSVNQGEVFCLLGPNGCGKTTLLDCVLGLLKPRQGQILLNGASMQDLSREMAARQISYVPQQHEKTFPYKVLDVVLMGRAPYIGMFDFPSREDVLIAEEALAMIGIERLKDRLYTELSGGEGQLVMVARALAQKTPLIVMDEPTAHLDFKHELTILETIVQLVKETGLSVLMATHLPNHTFYFEKNGISIRAALMDQESFLAIGQPTQVLTEENLRSLYNVQTKVVSYCLNDGEELKQVIPISTVA